MPLSLPSDPPRARSLSRVVPEAIAALEGRAGWFPPARSAVIAVIDGLGARNLTARAGHARMLASALSRTGVVRTVFPSTTAVALTSLLTGTPPGEHGIVGYRVRLPGSDVVSNQLTGWEADGLDPRRWQRAEPLMAVQSGAGRPCFVVSRARYRGTGFSEATARGAEFVVAESLSDRVHAAADLSRRHPGALVYVYVPELDMIAHRSGWQSDAWSAALEEVDAAIAQLADALSPGVGAVITADHGMVDVPRHRHVLIADGVDHAEGVRHIGGEPRMLHLYAEEGASRSVFDTWSGLESGRAWVMEREEAIAAGLFGTTSPAVHARIGDVIVAARAAIAYYDDRVVDKAPQRMVGQHGSLTDDERIVPLIGLGAFER